MSLYDSSNRNIWQETSAFTDALAQEVEQKYNMAYEDVSVFVGESVRQNTQAAYRKAIRLIDTDFCKKVLVINSSVRQHWALAEARKIDGRIGDQISKPVTVIGSPCGDLSAHFDQISEMISRHNIEVVMINSWEFASRDTRYKDNLLYKIRCLIESQGVSVIIYSHQMKSEPKHVGIAKRGCLGKLSAIAGSITTVELDEQYAIEREMEWSNANVEIAEETRRTLQPTIIEEKPTIENTREAIETPPSIGVDISTFLNRFTPQPEIESEVEAVAEYELEELEYA